MVDVVTVDTGANESASATSWGAIFAGAVVSVALTILLLTLASGVGFSTVSPWPGSNMSARTFGIVAGLYLIVVAILSSAVGGFIAGRLRFRWSVTGDEVFFRDTAHGLATWAVATVITVGVLASSIGSLASGTTSALTQGAATAGGAAIANSSNDYIADTLLRPGTTAAPSATGNAGEPRAEVGRIVARALSPAGTGLTAADKAYVAQLIAQRTGISQQDAEKRIDDTINQARVAADTARKAAATLSLWFAASLLIGAFSAAFAAAAGGSMRDDDRLITRNRSI